MHWLDAELAELDRRSLLRTSITVTPETATAATVRGQRVLTFCGNDYLGLRTDARLVAAAAEATERWGVGAGASRLVSGNLPIHEDAESALAALVAQPAALLVSSGYAANAGTLPALVGAEDAVFSDELNHASIVDACRLARANLQVFPHRDLDALRKAIAAARPFRRGIVVTESVFSMDGHRASLAALRTLCDDQGLLLYLDEAHALGVLGDHGEGLAASTGTAVDVLIGTLGKALGGAGAFVAGSESLRKWLWNRCRSFVFSTGTTPSIAATAVAGARIARTERSRRDALRSNVRFLRERLARSGVAIEGDPDIPILPWVIGDERRALAVSERLFEDGFFVQAIRPPTVQHGTARLRITVSAAHTEGDLAGFADAVARHAG